MRDRSEYEAPQSRSALAQNAKPRNPDSSDSKDAPDTYCPLGLPSHKDISHILHRKQDEERPLVCCCGLRGGAHNHGNAVPP